MDSEESSEIIIEFGVPQGSVLGPVLFNIYIRSLYSSVKSLKFLIHGYADDHQVYKTFKCDTQHSVFLHDVPECFNQIQLWMKQHFLQLNPGKTEIIVFGSPSTLEGINIKGIFLENSCIRFQPVVRNLGILLDEHLTFVPQVKMLKMSCFNKLRNISKMRKFLSTKQLIILTNAVILLALDYCNALYYGCPHNTIISHLQTVQNRACRVIFGLKKRESVADHLKKLHWLKVPERIEFKVLLLVFKGLNGQAPPYISSLLQLNNTSERHNQNLLIPTSVPPRCFSYAGPKLWHGLPNELKELSDINLFKKRLKTFLFTKSHNLSELC